MADRPGSSTIATSVGAPPRMLMRAVSDLGGSQPISVLAQFNPTELEENLETEFFPVPIIGMSFQPLQYLFTKNVKFNFELRFSAMQPYGTTFVEAQDSIIAAHDFLSAMCYPRKNGESIETGSPTRVLFVWPGFISMVCVIRSLSFKFTRFDQQTGRPTEFTAKLGIEEARVSRIDAADVVANGTIRGTGGQGGGQ